MQYAFIIRQLRTPADVVKMQDELNDNALEGWTVHSLTTEGPRTVVLLQRKIT